MKLTQKLMIHKGRDDADLTVCLADMSKYGYTPLGEVTVEFEFTPPSRAEQVKREVAILTAKKQQILAESHKQAKQLQDRIDSLLCLENGVEQHPGD